MIINGFRKVLDNYNKHHKPLSLRAVGRITGASTYSITSLYDGKANGIRFDVLNKLIKFFNVPVTDLISYQVGAFNFILINPSSLPKLARQTHQVSLYNHLAHKYHTNHMNHKIINETTILTDPHNHIGFSFNVHDIRYHKYDIDVGNAINTLMRPLHVADITHFLGNSEKADHYIDITIKSFYLGNEKNKDFSINLFNQLPKGFKNYIYVRTLLHSGLISKNINKYAYDFINDNYVHDLDIFGFISTVKLSTLVRWQKIQRKRKPKHSAPYSYYLRAKSGNYKVNLYDFTTNNFKS